MTIFKQIAVKKSLKKFLLFLTGGSFLLFFYLLLSPVISPVIPPVIATWDRVKDLSPQEVAHNAGGEQFMPIYETGNKDLNNRLERMLNMKNAMNSPLDDYGVINQYLVSRKLNINASIPFCIGVSDSQLGTAGKAVRTKNIGNIAHYDNNGNEKHYDSFKDGFEAIPRLLNRPQFTNTDLIGELSNGGRILLGLEPNCGGKWELSNKCYATSIENHYINLVRCVREIEDDNTIDYNFNFRI